MVVIRSWALHAGTALGLCLLCTPALAKTVDFSRLENGFVSGCMRQKVGCMFQHVQWLATDHYRVREVYVRRIRDAADASDVRMWLADPAACPTLDNRHQRTQHAALAFYREGAWHAAEVPRDADGCLRAGLPVLPVGGVMKLAVDSTVRSPPSAYSAFSVRIETVFPDRVGIVLQPGAVPVYFDLHDTDGSREVGLLPDTRLLLREVGKPARAIPALAASTVPSWQALARLHRQREDALLDTWDALPHFATTDPGQVVARAQRWVQQQVRYDFDPIRDGEVFPSRPVSALLAGGVADCKGMALLLRAVLRRNGLDAHTVAVSTAGQRPVSWVVPAAWANHVITYVPAVDRYVDAGAAVEEAMPQVAASGTAPGTEPALARQRFELGLDLATGHFIVIQ